MSFRFPLSKIFPFEFRQNNCARNESLNAIKQCCREVKEMNENVVRYSLQDKYDTAEEALRRSIAFSGRPQKDIASILWPKDKIEAAKTRLSRALSRENSDVSLSLKQTLSIMKETRPDDFLNYLCDEFGFERPRKKSKKDIQKEIEDGVKSVESTLSTLLKMVSMLGEVKED